MTLNLRTLRLKAKSLGLDPTGTREDVEKRILEKQNNDQTRNKPDLNLSNDVTMMEEPNLPEMMERIRLNAAKNETKFGVSAFTRLKGRGDPSSVSKRSVSVFARLKDRGDPSSVSKRKYRTPYRKFLFSLTKNCNQVFSYVYFINTM